MTLKDYVDSCRAFVRDTAEGGCDPYKQYVALPGGEWAETCDNHEGGVSLAWAFHETEDFIDRHAPAEFAEHITAGMQQGVDEEWDAEQ